MRIPVHVLTGFLGSGKTTLLDHLLRSAEAPRERIAVLVNELGDVALDHALVENIDDDIAVLSSGCVCCTLRDTLSESFARVRSLSPDRIVLETTGIADPAPVVHTLATDPRLTDGLRLGSVIAAVDAYRGEPLLEAEPEARAQLALADRIVITKLDLAHEARARSLEEHLKARYPGAVVMKADRGSVPRAELLSEVPLGGLTDRSKLSSWLHEHGGPGVDVRVIELEAPVNVASLSLWLRLVTQLDGPRLLRIKGAVANEAGEWSVLQSAQHAVSPARALAVAPRGFEGSRLVVIARGMPARALQRLIESAHEAARGQEV